MMKKERKFTVWETNRFSEETILNELTAHFYNLETAKDFVDYQTTLGNTYVIMENNKQIYPID